MQRGSAEEVVWCRVVATKEEEVKYELLQQGQICPRVSPVSVSDEAIDAEGPARTMAGSIRASAALWGRREGCSVLCRGTGMQSRHGSGGRRKVHGQVAFFVFACFLCARALVCALCIFHHKKLHR